MDFNLVRNTPVWFQVWFWLTCFSFGGLVFVKYAVLQERDASKAPIRADRLMQTDMRGSSISGDMVLGDKYTAPQEQDRMLLKQRRATIKIKRLFEDFADYLKKIVEQHRKDIDQIAQLHNFRNTYSSGPHLREQYDMVLKKRREILEKWIQLKRQVEDELLESGHTELTDEELKQEYDLAENKKDRAREEILEMAQRYFTSRSATFSIPDLEKLKQRVLDDKPF